MPDTNGDVVFLATGLSQPADTAKLGKRAKSHNGTVDSLPVDERIAPLFNQSVADQGTPTRTDTRSGCPPVLKFLTVFLVFIPDCQDLLGPVYVLLEARTGAYNSVLQIREKSDLVIRQKSGGGRAQSPGNAASQTSANGAQSPGFTPNTLDQSPFNSSASTSLKPAGGDKCADSVVDWGVGQRGVVTNLSLYNRLGLLTLKDFSLHKDGCTAGEQFTVGAVTHMVSFYKCEHMLSKELKSPSPL